MPITTIDGMMLRDMFMSGAALLEKNRQNIDALNLAAAQATRADEHALGHTIHVHANMLGVGSPGASGFMIGVAYIVAGAHSLMAYLTKLSHRCHTSF